MSNLTLVDRAFEAGKCVEHYNDPLLKPLSKSNYLIVKSSYEIVSDCNAELTRLQEKVKELEALAEKRKIFIESQVRINALLNEECERLRVNAARYPNYESAIGDAGENYIKSCCIAITPPALPGTFRWYELWDTMNNAAREAQQSK